MGIKNSPKMCHLIILLLEIYVNKFKMWTNFIHQDVCQVIIGKKSLKSALHFQQWEISQIDYGDGNDKSSRGIPISNGT